MLKILQWYIFREMGKTFLLTAIGITAVLSMGGGVLNMVELQNVGASQFLRLMALVTPVALTLAFPIAALFSAAVTYGRLSADNEFVACRASGINIHRLFLPTVLISLVSATATFAAINYVIPGQVRHLDRLVRADLSRIVVQKLQSPERMPIGKDRIRIYAEDPRVLADAGLPTDTEQILARGVAYAEMDGEDWRRYGTAEEVLIRFDGLDSRPTVAAEFRGVNFFDRSAHRWVFHERQTVPPSEIPNRFPLKVKWLTLSELLHYGKQVTKLPELADELDRLRAALAIERFFLQLEADFAKPDATGQPVCRLTFGDASATYSLQAGSMTPDLKDRRPTFESVVVVETAGDRVRTAEAGGATFSFDLESRSVRLTLFDGVTIRSADPNDPTVSKTRETLRNVRLPQSLLDEVAAIPDEALLDRHGGLSDVRGFIEKRDRVAAKCGDLVREIAGVTHSRLALSVSVFVLAILGAALGIILRGSHVLTAFGISFVPSIVVIVTIIMGKQLAENPGSAAIGLCTIWSGIVLVGGLDALTLLRLLRR